MSVDAERGSDDGFAMVAALGALLLFALFAYTVLAADRGVIADVDAQFRRARLEAAADAGLAIVVEGLGATRGRGWPLGGKGRTFAVDGIEITAIVEDERGKVSLNGITADEARRLFQGAGLSGAHLDQLTDNLLDWEDGVERPNGTKLLDYATAGIRPRGGPIRTLGELMAIRGMDSTTFRRIAPALTLFFGEAGGFEHATASPLALKAMGSDGVVTSTAAPAASYVGRPFTVRITAHDDADGQLQRSTIVELTGQPTRPVWIRAVGVNGEPGDP